MQKLPLFFPQAGVLRWSLSWWCGKSYLCDFPVGFLWLHANGTGRYPIFPLGMCSFSSIPASNPNFPYSTSSNYFSFISTFPGSFSIAIVTIQCPFIGVFSQNLWLAALDAFCISGTVVQSSRISWLLIQVAGAFCMLKKTLHVHYAIFYVPFPRLSMGAPFFLCQNSLRTICGCVICLSAFVRFSCKLCLFAVILPLFVLFFRRSRCAGCFGLFVLFLFLEKFCFLVM